MEIHYNRYMKKIPLTQGYFTKVDDEDFEELAVKRWYANVFKRRGKTRVTACRTEGSPPNKKNVYMHRLIMNAPDGAYIDHINGDSLDNRKENLRFCNNSENMRNRGKNQNNTSGYKGVSYNKNRRGKKKWEAKCKHNYKTIHFGIYETAKEASEAYQKGIKKLWPNFAPTKNKQ